jgi:ATP-dependent Clp protease ATP-binding subunit ClpA
MHPRSVALDPTLHSLDILEINQKLRARTIGQDDAVSRLVGMLETFFAGYNDPDKPVGVVLELGPTGTGKTTLIENLCEILFGNRKAYIKVPCAEFRESHQTNRIIGAPPGYIGFKDKSIENYFAQEKLDAFHNEHLKLTVVLLDEIEKSHSAFYEYLLNVFNDGEGSVSGKLVDFRHCLFVMTSNLGTRAISRATGFSGSDLADLNQRNAQEIDKAIRQHFEPEFINRIDETIIFSALSEDSIAEILDVELNAIRRRFLNSKQHGPQFVFKVQASARKEMVKQGFHPEYGARPLKRALKRIVVDKLASMVRSGQVEHSDLVVIGFEHDAFTYSKYAGDEIANLSDPQWDDFKSIA